MCPISPAAPLAPVAETPSTISPPPVSYTHLDVYKRQVYDREFGLRIAKMNHGKITRIELIRSIQ